MARSKKVAKLDGEDNEKEDDGLRAAQAEARAGSSGKTCCRTVWCNQVIGARHDGPNHDREKAVLNGGSFEQALYFP
jgi:hypothetical protein